MIKSSGSYKNSSRFIFFSLQVSSGQADHRVSPLNTYLITDQFRITGNDEQRIAFMNQVEGAWLKVIGKQPASVPMAVFG